MGLWTCLEAHNCGAFRGFPVDFGFRFDRLTEMAFVADKDVAAMAMNASPGQEKSAEVPSDWPLLKIHVALPSGRGETVSVSASGEVVDLKIAAEQSLGHPFLKLAAPDGRLLDPAGSLRLSGLQVGDSLTAVAQRKMSATRDAFALWCVGGNRIITWGDPQYGGNCSRVQDQLRNVQQICGTGVAFCRDFGRWFCGDVGCARPWWWQLQSARAAPECPADQWHRLGFRCHFGRSKRGDMGHSRLWWWQLPSPRSASACSADL